MRWHGSMNASPTPAIPQTPGQLLTVRNAVAFGLEPRELAAASRAGTLPRLRRGAYVTPGDIDPVVRHQLLINAAREVLRPDGVLSHCSAAVWLGLDLPWGALDQRVHITRGATGGSLRPRLATHTGPVPEGQWLTVDGMRVTTVARTVVDVARTAGYQHAVALADHALREHGGEVLRREMGAIASGLKGRKGIRAALRAIDFADARAESGGESVSRVVLAAMGIPKPVLQFEVFDQGRFIGRTDFGWPELGTLGEFDGRVKYRELPARQSRMAGEVVYREKVREDLLRDAGWEVVRWVWSDLDQPQALAGRLRAAFARADANRPAQVRRDSR